MNVSLGTKLSDGRRVGIEWRCRREVGGTAVQAFITHQGDLAPGDLSACLDAIGSGERLAAVACHHRRRRHRTSSR